MQGEHRVESVQGELRVESVQGELRVESVQGEHTRGSQHQLASWRRKNSSSGRSEDAGGTMLLTYIRTQA